MSDFQKQLQKAMQQKKGVVKPTQSTPNVPTSAPASPFQQQLQKAKQNPIPKPTTSLDTPKPKPTTPTKPMKPLTGFAALSNPMPTKEELARDTKAMKKNTPKIGPADKSNLPYIDLIKYITDDTKRKLDEGKPFFESRFKSSTGANPAFLEKKFDEIGKSFPPNIGKDEKQRPTDPYQGMTDSQRKSQKEQKKLYDAFKDWWQKTPKERREKTIKYYRDQASKQDEISIYGIGKSKPQKVTQDVIEGFASGATFGITDKLQGMPYKTEARQREAWYSPYNVSKMGGSIAPILPAMRPVKAGLEKVAPKLFKATAEDTAKQRMKKDIASELTADTIAGTAYGITDEAFDAAIDTREDGKQTIGERAKKVAADAAFGLVLGTGIVGAQVGIKKITDIRNTKKQNKEFDRILSSPDEVNKIVDDYAKLDAEHKRVGEIVQNLKKFGTDEKVIEKVTKKFDELDVAKKNYEDVMGKLQNRSNGTVNFNKLVDAKVKPIETKPMELPAPPKQTEEFIRLEQQYLNEADKLVAYMNRLESPDALRNIVSTYRALYNGPVNFTDVRMLNESQLADVVRTIASNRRGLASLIARRNGIDLDAMRKESMSQYGSKPDSLPLQFSNNNVIATRLDAETIKNRSEQFLVDEYDRLNAQLTNPELRSRLTDEQVDGINNRMEEVMNELNRLVQSSPEQRGQSVRNLRDRVVANREQQAQQRQTAAERIATVLQQRADAKRADYTDFWNQADIENPQVNEVLAEQRARQELPYEDVPVDRNGRIEYVIDNVVDYQTNVQKKSEKIISDADARLKELQNNRKDLIRQKEEYRTNEQNIERAVREYDEWVKLVQTVNALTREGGGIKFGRGQKAPSIFKKGSIPIGTVAQRLGMTVDELIKSMNLYEKMIPLSVKKASTLAKKKRQFASVKLTKEQSYIDIQRKIEQIEELVSAIEEIKPRTVEYLSRPEIVKDADYNPDDLDPFLSLGESVVYPTDTEMFSGYLIEKFFPESADAYRSLESRKDMLEKQIEVQEKELREIQEGVEEEYKILSGAQTDNDSLARMLVQFVKETGKKIHIYASEEDYYWFRKKRKALKMEDIPAWAHGYVILKPSRSFKNGRRQSLDRDYFNEHVRQELGWDIYGVSDEYSQRSDSADFFSNTEDQIYNAQTTFEAALDGNPYGSLADERKIKDRLAGILKEMGDENPVKIINRLKNEIENIDEQLVQLSKDVVDNRLGLIGDLPDSELASMIRDIKGEQVDFDKLLNDYMNEIYPDRVVPDVEPIRLEEATAPQAKPVQTPKETVLPQAQAKPTPANVMDNLPSRNEAQTQAQQTVTGQAEEVAMPTNEAPSAQVDEPIQTESPATETPTAPPVRTAGTSAPINQPDFAENIRQNPPEFATGDELFDEMPMNIDEPTMQGELPVNGDRLERGFNQTVRTSENTSEPLREDLQRQTDENETADLIDNPNWYARQSNSVLMLRADALLRTFKNKDGTIDYESAKNFLNKKRYILDVDNALAQKLIKHYEKEAMEAKGVNPDQYDRAMNSLMEVVNRIAPAGTELGRAVQAFSIYNKLDVDGILLMAQKAVNKRNQRRKFTKDGTLEDVAEPLMELANDLKKVDETKFLLDDVLELVKSKKAGEPLTEAEADLLQRFEQQVKELEDVLPNKPSNEETINIVEEIEPRLRTRDALLVYLNAMADEARKRLNKNKNTLNANPIGPWKDMIIIGANWMAKGVVRFADFSESALKEFGEAIRPRLTQLYKDSSKRFRKEQGLPTMTAVERAVNKAIRERKLGAEEADNLIQMATELAHYNDMSRVELLGDLQIALRNIEGVSFLRKLATAQTIAQLLNTKTLIRNVLGNELFWVTEKISKMLAVPIDMVASKMTGRAREIYFFTGNQESYWKNWFIGAKAGWKGYNPGGIATQYDLDSQVFTSAWNPLTYLEKALGVTLRSFDYASYRRAYGEAHASWAQGLASQEGLTGEAMKQRMKEIMATADNEVQAIFDQYGKYMTFQDETLLAQTFVKAKQAMNFNQDFGIGDLVLKYPFTPANLLMRAIDFSPVGIFRGLYQIGAATMRASKLGVTRGQALDKRKFVEQLSRGITGTMGFTAVGYYLAGLGILTGAPDPDAEVKQLQRSVGIAPYQVNFSALQRWVFSGFDREQAKRQDGDTMINYDWMQPVAVSLAIGTNLDKAEKEWMKDEKMGSVGSYFTGMWDAFDAGVTTLFQQPLIQGVTRLFTTYPGDTPTDKFIDVAAGLPSSFVPTAVNQARTLEDNQKRLTFDNTNKLAPFYTKVVDRLPFASRSLPVEYDGLGKPVEKYQDGSNNLFNVLLNPAFVTQYKGDPSAKTALEYIERTGVKSSAPRIPDKKMDDGTKLSREEYSNLLKLTGDYQNYYLDYYNDYLKALPKNAYSEALRKKIYENAMRQANAEASLMFDIQRGKVKP